MSHGRVGGRYMIEAMYLFDGSRERATHDQPHDQLDALGTRLAQVTLARNARQRLGVADHGVQEGIVELLVDESGAWALELVTHATRAPDLHVQIPVETVDGAANGLAQLVTAIARGRRVLHHVHREGNHAAGPGLRLAEHQ